MPRSVVYLLSAVVWCLVVSLSVVVPALANPNNYPQYAQQKVDPAISITFIGVDQVKESLDAGRQQLFVDVRSAEEYRASHLPQAVSIPLGVLSVRMAEIPRDIPVVLY